MSEYTELLERLNNIALPYHGETRKVIQDAYVAIRRLTAEQAQQEPVAEFKADENGHITPRALDAWDGQVGPLYLHPADRTDLKAWCSCCDAVKNAHLCNGISTDGKKYSDLCCSDCHLIIATFAGWPGSLAAPPQSEQGEPVAWRCKLVPDGLWFYRSTDPLLVDDCPWDVIEALYAAPSQAEHGVKWLDDERMKLARALQDILDYPINFDVINAAAQMKLIAVRAFTKPMVNAIDTAMQENQK